MPKVGEVQLNVYLPVEKRDAFRELCKMSRTNYTHAILAFIEKSEAKGSLITDDYVKPETIENKFEGIQKEVARQAKAIAEQAEEVASLKKH